jgi:hypothetical protein
MLFSGHAFATNGGKTSIYDAPLRQFYIAHTKLPKTKRRCKSTRPVTDPK